MRARVPDVVGAKDTGDAATLLELSQLVRDLCRQHDLDRMGWVQAAAAINHQADRIEVLEHEALQTTDDVSAVLEGHLQAFRASELALQGQLKGAFLDMTTAVMAVEQGLLAGIGLVKQEFVGVQQGEAKLLQELRAKFGQLEVAVEELHRDRSSPIRQPPPQHFTMHTPERGGAGVGSQMARHMPLANRETEALELVDNGTLCMRLTPLHHIRAIAPM